eukprot:2193589-Amphidinium_carterae.1
MCSEPHESQKYNELPVHEERVQTGFLTRRACKSNDKRGHEGRPCASPVTALIHVYLDRLAAV